MRARRATVSKLDRALYIGARTFSCGGKTERNPDRERNAKRKKEDGKIHADTLSAWKSLREFREHHGDPQFCDNQAKNAARHGEKYALSQQLPHYTRAARPQS